MYAQLLHFLSRRPEKYSDDGRNVEPTLLLMDEFPRFGKIDAIVPAITTLRSKKVNICLMAQSLAQLDMIYGQDARRVILDNCQYQVVLQANDADTQRYISDRIGTEKTIHSSISRSYNEKFDLIGGSIQNSINRERRIQPEELSSLKDAIIMSPYGPYLVGKTIPNREELRKFQAPNVIKAHVVGVLPDGTGTDEVNVIEAYAVSDFDSETINEGVKMLTIEERTKNAAQLAEQAMHDIRAMKYDEQSADKNKAARRNYALGELVCQYLPALVDTIPVAEDSLSGTPVVFEDVLMLIAEDYELMEDLKAKASGLTGQDLNTKRCAARAKSGQYNERIRYVAGEIATKYFPELLSIEPGTKEENAERFSFFERFLAILSDEEHLVLELIREARMITCDDGDM